MHIDALVQAVDMPAEPRRALEDLLERKRVTPELGAAPRVAALDEWAVRELERLEPGRLGLPDGHAITDQTEKADHLFRSLNGIGKCNESFSPGLPR